MTVQELEAILFKLPPDAEVKVRSYLSNSYSSEVRVDTDADETIVYIEDQG